MAYESEYLVSIAGLVITWDLGDHLLTLEAMSSWVRHAEPSLYFPVAGDKDQTKS